ncbi:MAG: hypothetical protein ABL931_05125 [Usitatibacteraceae bacterium]
MKSDPPQTADAAPANQSERRILHWQDIESWQGPYLAALADVINDRVIEELQRLHQRFYGRDDLYWLDRLIWRVHRRRVQMEEEGVAALCDAFDAVRAFHGTRVPSPDAFRTGGLVPLNIKDAAESATRFFSAAFPRLQAADFETARAALASDAGRAGKVYFDLSRHELLTRSTHYLLYGSEYRMGFAANLPNPIACQAQLKRQGKPTLLACDVPLDFISEATLTELNRKCVRLIACRLKGLDIDMSVECFGFSIARSLPPECVNGHEHPEKLHDWHAAY